MNLDADNNYMVKLLTNSTSRFKEFNFARKKKIQKTPLEQDIKSLRLNVKAALLITNSIVSQKVLLKIINDAYEELLLLDREKRKDLTSYLFEKYMTKYGLKKVAQRNIIRIMSSCMKYKDIPKVRLFSRFIKLYDGLTLDDLSYYLDLLEFSRNMSQIKKNCSMDGYDGKIEEV